MFTSAVAREAAKFTGKHPTLLKKAVNDPKVRKAALSTLSGGGNVKKMNSAVQAAVAAATAMK